MNKEIIQTCQKISVDDIINKKFDPVWFFTNEQIAHVVTKLESQKEIKKIFSIGGGGDFAFSLLSSPDLSKIEQIDLCDIRPLATISIDLKIGLCKIFEYPELLVLLRDRDYARKGQIYEKVKLTVTEPTRQFIASVIDNCKEKGMIRCLEKSGLWYKDSFWQIKNKSVYLPYLATKEKYSLLQKNLEKIRIHSGDFDDNLKTFENDYFDLIYASNILDSKKYCREPELYLRTIKEKLGNKGFLLLSTQNNPRKMIRTVGAHGFRICENEHHRFNPIGALLGHYAYSFLLFQKQ